MAPYKVELLKSATRDIRKVDKQYITRIVITIRSLANNPFPKQLRKLHGTESSFRLRVGDYRIIYEVDTERKVVEYSMFATARMPTANRLCYARADD